MIFTNLIKSCLKKNIKDNQVVVTTSFWEKNVLNDYTFVSYFKT